MGDNEDYGEKKKKLDNTSSISNTDCSIAPKSAHKKLDENEFSDVSMALDRRKHLSSNHSIPKNEPIQTEEEASTHDEHSWKSNRKGYEVAGENDGVVLRGKKNTAVKHSDQRNNESLEDRSGRVLNSNSEDLSLDRSLEEGDIRTNVTQCRCMPKRYVLAILSFFGFFNVYCLRVDLSVALVAMTNNHTRVRSNGSEYWVEAEFDWTSQLQGHILSAFYYGYLITQIPGGYIAARFGGKNLFGIAILFSAIFTLLTPVASRKHWSLLFALRFMEGLCEGCIYPAMYSLWSRWAPPMERARLVTIPHSGSYSGSVAGTLIAGYLCELCGWAWVFYLFGLFALMWVAVWQIMISDSPEEDRHISKMEKHMILESLRHDQTRHYVTEPLPWCQIFTSMPFLAILVAHTCEGWGFGLLQTSLPKYLSEAMNFRISKTGEYTATMYLIMGISVFISGQLSDYFRQNDWLTATMARKVFTITGFTCNGLAFLISIRMSKSEYAIITLIVGAGIESLAWCGFGINHLDIAPRYASLLFGITNTCATVPGIVSPLMVGAITSTGERSAWDAIFIISSFMFICGAIFYGVFASAERQPWAEDPLEKDKRQMEH